MVTDQGDSAILVMLDLTAAFDMIDHEILIVHLQTCVGMTGTVSSYLKDRRFSVRLGNLMSSAANLPWGVPQGSILAPTLFSLYMLPLGSIFRKHCVSFFIAMPMTPRFICPFKRSGNILWSVWRT